MFSLEIEDEKSRGIFHARVYYVIDLVDASLHSLFPRRFLVLS